jgi:hypothetical protein
MSTPGRDVGHSDVGHSADDGEEIIRGGHGGILTRRMATLALQRAIAYVNEIGGGVVYLPRGTYYTSATLTLYPNVIPTPPWTSLPEDEKQRRYAEGLQGASYQDRPACP